MKRPWSQSLQSAGTQHGGYTGCKGVQEPDPASGGRRWSHQVRREGSRRRVVWPFSSFAPFLFSRPSSGTNRCIFLFSCLLPSLQHPTMAHQRRDQGRKADEWISSNDSSPLSSLTLLFSTFHANISFLHFSLNHIVPIWRRSSTIGALESAVTRISSFPSSERRAPVRVRVKAVHLHNLPRIQRDW